MTRKSGLEMTRKLTIRNPKLAFPKKIPQVIWVSFMGFASWLSFFKHQVHGIAAVAPWNNTYPETASHTGYVVPILAYHLQISNDNAAKAPRLLRSIHHSRNLYALHTDTNCDPELVRELHELVQASPSYRNVRFMVPTSVTYCGITNVLNTIDAMAFLLAWDDRWTYFINMSGSDYPLLPQEDIISLLMWAKDRMRKTKYFTDETFATPSFVQQEKGGVVSDRRWSDDMVADLGLSEVVSKLKSYSTKYPVEPAFPVGFGSAWVILSQALCRFHITSGEVRRMIAFFSTVPIADEHFFQTTQLQARARQLAGPVANDHLRAIFWSSGGEQSRTLSPLTLDNVTVHWPTLVESGALIARKFSFESSMLDHIDSTMQDHISRAQLYRKASRRLAAALDDI